MLNESQISHLKRTTCRGSKVKKILKFLKNYEFFMVDPENVIIDGLDDYKDEKEKLVYSYIGCRIALDDVSVTIKNIFEMDLYKKEVFKKKVFSGAKIISIFNYVENAHARNIRQIEFLNELPEIVNKLIDSTSQIKLLESQNETYLSIYNWLNLEFIKYADLDDDNDDYLLDSILKNLTSDEDIE